MIAQLSKISKPVLATILGIVVAWWKKSRNAQKALTACAWLSIGKTGSAKKLSIPDKVEGADKIVSGAENGEVAINDQCVVQWVGGRGRLTNVKVQEKVKATKEIVSAGPLESIRWVGGCGKISTEAKITKQCVVQWNGGRGCMTTVSTPRKLDEVVKPECRNTKQTIEWIGGRGVLAGGRECDESVMVTPRANLPSYQLPTPMKIEKEEKRTTPMKIQKEEKRRISIDITPVQGEAFEYNKIVVGDKLRYSDGQEAILEGYDNDGDMVVRRVSDGSNTVWYADKCSKAAVQIGDVVRYSCGQRARVDSFDADGDIVVRKSSGIIATWYKDKVGAPVQGVAA